MQDEPKYIPLSEDASVNEGNQFRGCHDHDYRITIQSPTVPSGSMEENWKDVDTRPNLPSDSGHTSPAIFPSAIANKALADPRPISLIPTPIIESSCKPRGRITHLPVPEHLMTAFGGPS